jgi:hypothetical protein
LVADVAVVAVGTPVESVVSLIMVKPLIFTESVIALVLPSLGPREWQGLSAALQIVKCYDQRQSK